MFSVTIAWKALWIRREGTTAVLHVTSCMSATTYCIVPSHVYCSDNFSVNLCCISVRRSRELLN